MGYSAKFSGVIFMDAEQEKIDAVKAFLEKGLIVDYVDVSIDKNLRMEEKAAQNIMRELGHDVPKPQAVIEFESDGLTRYDEEDMFIVLGNLKDYITSGEIEYEGEDDTYWKHEFKDGKWSELSGQIVYSNPKELSVQSEKEAEEILKEATREKLAEELDMDR